MAGLISWCGPTAAGFVSRCGPTAEGLISCGEKDGPIVAGLPIVFEAASGGWVCVRICGGKKIGANGGRFSQSLYTPLD